MAEAPGGGSRAARSLGEKLSLESSTLTPLLKRLEKVKHIKRTRDPLDEHQVRVRLIDKGRALRREALEIPACILAASGLTVDDLRRLQGEIAALRNALESYNSEGVETLHVRSQNPARSRE